jgi:hypothetical protein
MAPIETRHFPVDALEIQKARETARALLDGVMDWVELISCHQHIVPGRDDEVIVAETIVFETEVQLSQLILNEIQKIERIAVTFRVEDKKYPRIFALREDFPDVMHLNLEPFEIPRSICLYEEPYPDVKLRWTAISFIERIRQWLADTATGTLHRADQSLEPLLIGNYTPLILPSVFFSESSLESLPKLRISCNKKRGWRMDYCRQRYLTSAQFRASRFFWINGRFL